MNCCFRVLCRSKTPNAASAEQANQVTIADSALYYQFKFLSIVILCSLKFGYNLGSDGRQLRLSHFAELNSSVFSLM